MSRLAMFIAGAVVVVLLGSLALRGCTHLASARGPSAVTRFSSGELAKLEAPAPAAALGHKRFVRTDEVLEAERRASDNPGPGNLTKLAEAYLDAGDFQHAADTYYRLADLFFERDDENSALAEIRQAQQFETKIGIFEEIPAEPERLEGYYSGARNEPLYGCYTGAFIDHETGLKEHTFDKDLRRDVAQFNKETGVHHACYFIYLGYGKPFPKEWIEHLKKNGAMAQIAFEPTSYEQVQDDSYLRQFARDAKASGVPIFLRFASEMNGDWVCYHKSPERYIEMFQLVSRVMHEETDNVAMVWCPFEIPQRYILRYYPGKEAVDWVGINIYSVLYNDNDPNRNAQGRNPADGLKFIYKHFAKDHPIMIGEYAAASKSSLDMVPRSDYAIMKLKQFYSCLPLLYPRVKAVHWLSMNAIKHAYPGRQLNDYSVLEDRDVSEAYRSVNETPYFLKQFVPKAVSPTAFPALEPDMKVRGSVALRAWVKTYTNLPTVAWLVDGVEIGRSSSPGMYPVDWDTSTHPNGEAMVEVAVLDKQGYEISRKSVAVQVSN